MVKVHVGRNHNSVAKDNCVTVKWGGEQSEANRQSAGESRTRDGAMWRRAFPSMAKPETH